MSNPTTPFGWQMPTATDLVTDLPADFEVFGQAVATSMADLLGGTTGQILTKASNTDMDFTWSASNPGDITGVTAGTGISGGGTSGDVTITNDMATTITASGDIVVGTGSGTYDNLPIGTTGQILTADTTVSPYKVKWATPSSGSTFVGVSLTKSAVQSCANNTGVKITWDTENFDTDNFHDPSTNTSRITIPAGKAGKYSISATGSFSPNATGQRYFALYVNNVLIIILSRNAGNSVADLGQSGTAILNLAVSDYVELEAFQNSGGALNFSDTYSVLFSAQYLGA